MTFEVTKAGYRLDTEFPRFSAGSVRVSRAHPQNEPMVAGPVQVDHVDSA